ncbi:hypothetical protein [Vibrio agarivorans]|uniref:Uncharacterized protein n=1 Tax=Vibrio agarivorans TaxID=153622 RepID=A0ABT7Y7G3_9VIBR|nr:hypothetical protein [Vibrio agarivorans]MDN2483983.1 hypothetical protein [Vibrio agarivorans]
MNWKLSSIVVCLLVATYMVYLVTGTAFNNNQLRHTERCGELKLAQVSAKSFGEEEELKREWDEVCKSDN